MRTKFFIPFDVPSSKNGKRYMGGGRLISSKSVFAWKKKTESFWEADKEEFIKSLNKLSLAPHNIRFTFYRKTRHKFDYTNKAETVLDEMKNHGWIEDDNVDIIKPFFGDYVYNKLEPGVMIEILIDKQIKIR